MVFATSIDVDVYCFVRLELDSTLPILVPTTPSSIEKSRVLLFAATEHVLVPADDDVIHNERTVSVGKGSGLPPRESILCSSLV